MEPDENERDIICRAFKHQVGGHKCVLQLTENLICKPCEETERTFYNNVPSTLQPYVPRYRGEVSVCCRDNDGQRVLHARVPKSILRTSRTCLGWNGETEEENWSSSRVHHCIKNESLWKNNTAEKFIIFDNLIANFEHPCALDIKLCQHYHGICVDKNKRRRLEQKCKNSTSSTLGFRIGGMQIYQQETKKTLQFNKYYGMTINDKQAIELLKIFFGRSGKNLRDVSATLRNMHSAILNQTDYIFLSLSLLFFYDNVENQNNVTLVKPEPEENKAVRSRCKVFFIDFEKAIPATDKEVMLLPVHLKENINYGMTTLVNILDSIELETHV